jgi:NAD(P)-dependent dehydrogenase (short-subunit alcohol dehydrogenase family)
VSGPTQYLDGNAVVVTGSGRGLGRAYAHHIAASGGRVVVNDVDPPEAEAVAQEIRDAGGQAIAVAGSVADWGQAQALIEACVAEFGAIDGLVNNAGIFHASAPWDETEERVRRIVEVNVLGSMFCGLHALTAMRAAGRGGAIVNVTSGAHLGLHEISSYGATKGAATSMTYGWALHERDTGVRVNAVSPTAFTRMSDPGSWNHIDDIPSNPEPDVIAPVVTFLLGDRARDINGQVVRLDGVKLSLLTKARFGDDVVEGTTWSVDVIADAFERGALGPLSPIGMAHPANASVVE